jgi:formylglycine-generating enzyme required for sulfatase activity
MVYVLAYHLFWRMRELIMKSTILVKLIFLFSLLNILFSCGGNFPFVDDPQNKSDKSYTSSLNFTSSEPGMVYIPGGQFKMGSARNANEMPVHLVKIKPFYIDKHEVTVAEYRKFCEAVKLNMPKQPKWSRDSYPVVNISWKEANAYAKWQRKRLPTEAEWEFVARGGRGKNAFYAYGAADLYIPNYGNIADESIRMIKIRFPVKRGYSDNYPYASPVGSFNPNIFGVYDMEGNVLEWCSDWYDAQYYRKRITNNPQGPLRGKYKSIRGASWNRSGRYLRATYRTFYPPAVAYPFLGFRCVKDISETSKNASSAPL